MLKDIVYGIRMLTKNPGVTLVAVITLGLGIGANTAIFSAVNAFLLKPLPVPRPNELIRPVEMKISLVPSRERYFSAKCDEIDASRSKAQSRLGWRLNPINLV